MTSKMIFLNICVAIIAFSLFLLLFLKPRTGSQFETIQSKEKPKGSSSKIVPTPNATSQVTPVVSPKSSPSKK